MKTIEKPTALSILKLAFLAVLLLTFSCSPDTVLQENLEAANAKSKAKNDKKSANAVLKTLVKGAALNAANGLDIGPDGNLYIASVNGQEIAVMNKNNGKIIKSFGPENQVLGPDDLVFGPDGTLYWTDILTGFVGRMTTDGDLLGYHEVAPGVNPIRFSKPNPDPEADPEDPKNMSRLFVALDFLGDGLYELDPNLNPENVPEKEPRLIIECTLFNPDDDDDDIPCLGFFNSFDTRWEDGRLYLYGPLFAANLVIAIDVTDITETKSFGPLLSALGDPSIRIVAGGDGSFDNPAATKFGPDGMLYVLDQAGNVFKINTETGDQTLFATLQPGLDNMTFDEDGTLYMTNNDEGWVAEIFPNGQARFISPGGMILPQGLAVLPGANNQDAVFEADLFRLRQFNGTNGQQENIYKGYLINPDLELPILPMNLSADGDDLVVSSWFSSGVQVWNPQDGIIENYPDVIVPIDAVRVNGDIVVSDYGLGGVVYASNNALIAPLSAASGLATDGETLWAADQESGEIWHIKFDSDPPNATLVANGLDGPEGLALDNQGRLLVVEAGASRLSRIDLTTGDVTVLVEGLDLFGPGLGIPPTWGFDGVAVGLSGDIYVSGAGANVIYKIQNNKVN